MTCRTAHRPLLYLGLLLALGFVGLALLPVFLVYAPSASLPKGWYVRDFETRAVDIGDIVVVTMPQGAWTTPEVTGLPPRLLKLVAAIPGDQVCWDGDGMTVVTARGRAVYPYHAEKLALRRADACLTVPSFHLILVGDHPRSFDSRYIGMVHGQLLQFRVRPLWTWRAV